jgi:hypothetical protein
MLLSNADFNHVFDQPRKNLYKPSVRAQTSLNFRAYVMIPLRLTKADKRRP